MTRRDFLQSGMAAAAWATATGCEKPTAAPALTVNGPNYSLGHKLRQVISGEPKRTEKTNVVIVGGGVAGLSAARVLKRQEVAFQLLELEQSVGGNSLGGENKVSRYPLGAHYLPIPSASDVDLLTFLEECGTVTGYNHGLPVYNEYHLCFDPKERLFIHHHWQEGLIPHEGVPKKDRDEIARFLELMAHFREKVGADGRKAFNIPVNDSSRDASLLALDRISMQEFLSTNGFHSPYLRWYVEYCCADDFGSALTDTSAWAGIHYFASRQGKAGNAKSDDVLTWPEGNYWLVRQLQQISSKEIKTGALVYHVETNGKEVRVDYLEESSGDLVRITADAAIMCSPQYINARILSDRKLDLSNFQYAPWLVANITLTEPLNERRGEPLCWDNVIYGKPSLGYVHSGHQRVGIDQKESVVTFYKPLLGRDCAQLRQTLFTERFDGFSKWIMEDLTVAHPNLSRIASHIDVWRWGHGMIRPQPNFIWGGEREAAAAPLSNRIFFAHTDLAGVSIFEEGFHAGMRAARQITQWL